MNGLNGAYGFSAKQEVIVKDTKLAVLNNMSNVFIKQSKYDRAIERLNEVCHLWREPVLTASVPNASSVYLGHIWPRYTFDASAAPSVTDTLSPMYLNTNEYQTCIRF